METSNHSILTDLIAEAFSERVVDGHGKAMPEAYLLDDWQTPEGFLVNGITPSGLIYAIEGEQRQHYDWTQLQPDTLQQVLSRLQEEQFC